MVPYDELCYLDQLILNWRNEHIELIILFLVALTVGSLYFLWKNQIAQEKKMREERARKRAWIKAHGGL